MIYFPNVKLNIGLNITSKREDGYHNIETVFYPIEEPYDILEIIDNQNNSKDNLSLSGYDISGKLEDNLVIKALDKIRQKHKIPPLEIYLHKVIPAGSGLGGGSSNAAHIIKYVNKKFSLNLTNDELKEIAQTIGADCAVFIDNKPVLAKGIGTEFSDISLSLSGYWIQIVIMPIHVSTKEAYSIITPKTPETSLEELILLPIEEWKNNIVNDFEEPIFNKYNKLRYIKTKLYEQGAIYASMSGSGSSIYGIFKEEPSIMWSNNFRVFTHFIK